MGKLVPVITGPTASGKSAAAFIIAQMWETEIISADSRQVYKYLNIGTAKPSVRELADVKHHFIDYCEPDDSFSAGKFEQKGRAIIHNLLGSNKIPLICGGTGLYINALRDGILQINADDEYRDILRQIFTEQGSGGLHAELMRIDPIAAARIPHSTHKRVARALEVFYLTGESIITLMEKQKKNDDLDFVVYCLFPEREFLYKNINTRVERMIEQGLVQEVESLLSKYPAGLNALNTVGYKETIDFLNGNINKDEMIRLIKRNSRHYAKRQFTWFRKIERMQIIELNSNFDAERIASYISDDFNKRIGNER